MKINMETILDVANLQNAYVQAIDDDRLDEWPEFFTEQCLYQIMPRENFDEGLPAALVMCDSKGMLVDRIVSFRQANIYNLHFARHIIGIPRILESRDGVIKAETNYAIFQTQMDGETSVFQVGRYLDTIVSAADGMKFKEKVCVFDTYRVHRLLSTPI